MTKATKRNPEGQPEDPTDDMGETWICIRPLQSPEGVRASRRLAGWLKSGLRAYYLRCTRVSGCGPDNAAGAIVGAGKGGNEK